MKTLVLQSFREEMPGWIQCCLNSVRNWSEKNGYTYHFIGDELFDLVPSWYREKVGERFPILADLARLELMKNCLQDSSVEQVIWFDADVLVLDDELELDFLGSCAFGQEVWVQRDSSNRLKAKKNVHNALCIFRQGCPVLPFLIHTVQSIIRRVDAEYIAPQMVGPKLLSALHSLADFKLLSQVGAFSPLVIEDIINGSRDAITLMKECSLAPLQAVNICASLVDNQEAELVCNTLCSAGLESVLS